MPAAINLFRPIYNFSQCYEKHENTFENENKNMMKIQWNDNESTEFLVKFLSKNLEI